MTEHYCYSFDSVNFTGYCESREAALVAGITSWRDDDDVLYIGRCLDIPPAEIYHTAMQSMADHLIDQLCKAAYARVGWEMGNDWLLGVGMTGSIANTDFQKRLVDMVTEWATANELHPRFYDVIDIEEYGQDWRPIAPRDNGISK